MLPILLTGALKQAFLWAGCQSSHTINSIEALKD